MNTTKPESRAYCPACLEKLTPNQLAFLVKVPNSRRWCPCGELVILETMFLELTDEGPDRVTRPRNFTWFHGTTVEDWYNKLVSKNMNAHIGEEEASWDILCTYFGIDCDPIGSGYLRKFPKGKFFLWELEFASSTVFSGGLHEDTNDESLYDADKASVYLNRFESPGSMSVYTPVRYLRPVGVHEVTPEEIVNCGSLYTHKIHVEV